MGNDHTESPRKPRTRSRTETPSINPFGSARTGGAGGDLGDVPGITGILSLACEGGRAVMLGHTRDGGAWVIQVLDGDNRYKQYAATQGELDDVFQQLQDAYGG